jgi:surface protein
MDRHSILEAAKHLDIKQNVSIQVIDQKTGQVVQEHTGHNSATNSLLFGIAHHLIGDFLPNEGHGLNPGYSMLSNYVPRYISLGTMGLLNQKQDMYGLPAGIGDFVPDSSDPYYRELQQAVEDAKQALDDSEEALAEECPYWPATEACENCQVCSDRIAAKKQAVEDAKVAYEFANDAFVAYSEEARFVEYMQHTPGFGADGYSESKNNGRKYFGLGKAFTSYDVLGSYKASSRDQVTYKGILYECKADTAVPAGPFDTNCWRPLDESEQPSVVEFDEKGVPHLKTTINLELISPSYPRTLISYRDVVPEKDSEQPKILDVVYSALISTGALKQFRPDGQDYIFITEAGLWSKKPWSDGNENGLLAGYRIGPPNSKNWDMTDPKNRKILKENILKVGKNQVVQVVWKIQIGSIDEFIKETGGEYVPPYCDTLYYTIDTAYSNSLNHLLVDKVVSTDRNAPVSFIKSDTKRGCPVPNDIFRTNLNADGPLYLDFVFNENGEEIIYWWTETGEVNYYDNYVSHMFDNMNVVAYELDGWHYISPSVYITNTGIYELADLVDTNSYYRFTPLFTENQLPPGTELPTNRNRSNNSTPLYYYDEHGELQLYYDDLYYFIHNASEPVTTSNEDYKVYVGRSEGYYYCGATLEFYDNWNFRDINNVLCFTTPEPDSDTDSDTDTEGPESRSLTHLSYRGWDTARLTSLSHAFDGCNHIENIDLTGWNTSNITDMSFAFSNTNYLKFLIGIDAWDVSNVIDMDHMFYGCGTDDVIYCGVNDPSQYEDYTILTLDAWDTSRVTNMDYMFAKSYVSIPYKSFNTSNVTSMVGTFNYAHHVDYDTDAHEDIIGAKLLWDTSNVTNMSYMFYESFDCRWDLSRLNTSSVTNAEGMFYFARTVNYSTITLLDVHNVTNFSSMFENADGHVYNNPYLEPHAFEWIDVSHWRTSSATNMSRMFYSVSTYIKGVENFNTSNVTDFSSMFEYAYIEEPNSAPNVDEYGLVHIDLSNWDVHSGEDFNSMFERTSETTHYRPRYYYTFEGFDEWNVTSNAISVRYMFSDTIFPFNSSNPMTLDFSGWNMSGVGNYQGMFRRLLGTEGTIEPPTDVRCTVILPSTLKPLSMFYSTDEMFKEANIQKLVWNGVSVYSNSEFSNVKQMFRNSRLVEIVATNWDLSGVTSISDLFYMQYLRKINISGWDVSNVTNFSRMLCKWETSQWYTNQYSTPGIMDYSSMNNWVVNPDSTFTNMCSGNLCDDEAIAQLDGYHAFEQPYVFPNWTGTWDTTNLQSTVVTATNFPYYYQQAGESYTAYYLGTKMTTGGTVDPTSMDARFVNTPSKYTDFGTFTPTQPVVEPVTLSSTGISQLRNATTSDNRFISLATGYHTDILVYADPDTQYYNPEIPTSLGMTAEEFKEHANYLLDTTDPNIKVYYDGEYYWCDAPLQFSDNTNFAQIVDAVMSSNVSFRGWDASNITSLNGVFDHRTFESLALDMDYVNMITNLSESFTEFNANCLWGLDSWDTSHVTTMHKAFSDRYIYTGYYFGGDISSWDTSNVTDMSGLFENVRSYIPYAGYDFFDISNLDTSKVTNMSRMFYNSYGLWVDLSGLNTSKVTNMSYMFHDAEFCRGLDLGSWDVSHVTDMSYMFSGGRSYDDLTGLGEWDTSSVETFEGIFAYGYSGTVEAHYPPSGILNWDISNARTFDHMFDSCTLSDFDCDDFISWFSPTGYFTCSYAFAGATLPSKYSQTYGGYLFDVNHWPSMGSCQDSSYMFAYSKISDSDLSILSVGSGIALAYNVTNIFKGTDIDVLVMDGVSIDSHISATWKDIFKYTGESIEDDSPKFSKLIATYWNIIDFYDLEADISNLFSEMHYLTKVDLSNWDVTAVTNFSEMFYKPDSTLPGVLDFTSLDSWSNIDLTANFTRMCASNLQDDESAANEGGYHAFEQGYRFPNWQGGTWDTTGLQQVHIDSANYPYYYIHAGEEYDAYCFGTQVVDGVVRLINKPPANSTFGTFIPQSTSWDYDWDFTSSLVDTEQSANLTFADNTTTPATGEWVQGTGIRIQDADGKNICVPATLFIPGTVVEFDVTDCTMYYRDWADSWIIGNLIGDASQYIGFITADEDYGQWGFSADWYTFNPTVEHAGFVSLGVEGLTYFANSTFKIESDEGANGKLVLKFYKDNTLLATTPELNHNNTDFLPKNNTNWEFFLTVSNMEDVTITGLRIRNGSQS